MIKKPTGMAAKPIATFADVWGADCPVGRWFRVAFTPRPDSEARNAACNLSFNPYPTPSRKPIPIPALPLRFRRRVDLHCFGIHGHRLASKHLAHLIGDLPS